MTIPIRIGDVEWEATPDQAADLLRYAASQLLGDSPGSSSGPLDVEEAAATLGVSVEWVREHAAELGGWKVDPSRPRSHWRFDRDKLRESRESSVRTEDEPKPPKPRRRRQQAPLLEVRGKPAV